MFSPIIWLWFNKWWKKRNNIQNIIAWHVEQWAKEFFCWYNPPYWHNKFWFEVSPNGRFAEHEQITDFESLQEVIKEVHKHWKKIMWNINHRYYTDVVEEEFKHMIQDFLDAWIDGFIVSSMWTLEYLDDISEWTYSWWYIIQWKKIQLNISTIMAVYNTDAIQYLKDNYPITKVILSREITLTEIENILKTFPELTFEVFGEWDFCRYNNGLCFAEHKYTDRDICTVVVNDLIVKKSINYDFRKIIKDDNLQNNEKAQKFDNEYKDEFEILEWFLDSFELWENNIDEISKMLKTILNKYIIFYDPLQWPKTKHNNEFNIIYKTVEILEKKWKNIDNLPYFVNLNNFKEYIEKERKNSQKQYLQNIKELVWWKFWVETKYKDNFYNRSDNLNLFSYIFFDNFENIDTVKFPTRWRNYLPKIQLIANCIENKNTLFDNLDLNISPERSHYDLKSLFDNNKFWFYDLRKKLYS